MNDHINKIWWLWAPLALIALQAVIELFVPANLLPALHSESGPHETLQFLLLAGAFLTALWTLIRMKKSPLWLFGWVALAALCTFYVGGEEISWGQHIIQWNTPEYWAALNDQGETNLHNTSSWLDQKPRLILLIGVVMGGLIFPALQKFKPKALPETFAIIYPPAYLGVTAALALFVNLSDKIVESFTDQSLFHRGSEVEEIYLFYFVLMYLIALRHRVIG